MRTLKRILRAAVPVLLAALCAAILSCSGGNGTAYLRDPVMTYRGKSITEGEFRLYLARYKYQFGVTYSDFSDTQEFYNSKIGYRTAEERLFEEVVTNVSRLLVADYMFSSGGFTLPAGTGEEINAALDERDSFLRAEGSSLEKDISKYGLTRDEVYELMLRDEKVFPVYRNLDSTGRLKTDDAYLQSYLEQNYVRFMHIYINNAYEYETDDAGYHVYDSSGNWKTVPMNAADKAAKDTVISEIDGLLGAGTDFHEVYEKYSEDRLYDRGYYLTKNSDFIKEVIDCAFGLEPGSWNKVESEYGTSYVMRLEMDEKPWEDASLSDFFKTYPEDRKKNRFTDILDSQASEIEYDHDILDRYTVQASNKESNY